jgi:glycosyltransferase involved in cell wall biosynthesis
MKIQSRNSDVSVVHINDPDALTRIRYRKLATTVYDLIPLRLGIPRRRLIGWAGYQAYLWALRHTDLYLAISRATASDLEALLGIAPSKIAIVPPGIDISPPIGPARKPVRPYFLFVGGPNPNKNLSVLLNAMALCRDLPEELVIAGHWLPRQLARLDTVVEGLDLRDRVRCVGFVPEDELPACMREATALVMPSRLEGFGLPVGEGLTAGAVVLHSRIPVLEETSAGAALTFDPVSAEELAKCMRRVSRDTGLADVLRQRGRDRSRHLTWDAAVDTTLSSYQALLDG